MCPTTRITSVSLAVFVSRIYTEWAKKVSCRILRVATSSVMDQFKEISLFYQFQSYTFGQNYCTLQRGLSAIAEHLVFKCSPIRELWNFCPLPCDAAILPVFSYLLPRVGSGHLLSPLSLHFPVFCSFLLFFRWL